MVCSLCRYSMKLLFNHGAVCMYTMSLQQFRNQAFKVEWNRSAFPYNHIFLSPWTIMCFLVNHYLLSILIISIAENSVYTGEIWVSPFRLWQNLDSTLLDAAPLSNNGKISLPPPLYVYNNISPLKTNIALG